MIVKRNLLKNNNYQYLFYDGDNTLKIYLNNNKNLCFETFSYSNSSNISFEIDKSNYQIYNLFNKLYNDIKKSNVIEIENYDSIISLNTNDVEKLNNQFKLSDSYKNLFNNGIITFISDNSTGTDLDSVNYFQMIKAEDKYILNFGLNDYIYKNEIMINSSNSRYEPYNTCFINFYNRLCSYDPNYHQVHIEELFINDMYNSNNNLYIKL